MTPTPQFNMSQSELPETGSEPAIAPLIEPCLVRDRDVAPSETSATKIGPRIVGQVTSETLFPAVSLLYQHLAEPERGKQVAILIKGMLDGSIASRFFYASVDNGSVAGVLWCLPMPGRSVWVWPPVVAKGYCNDEIETELLRAAAADFDASRGDVSFAQCLVPWDDRDHAQPLLRAGFTFRTDLEFLSCELSRLPGTALPGPELPGPVAESSTVPLNDAVPLLVDFGGEQTNSDTATFSLDRLPTGKQPGDIAWLQYSSITEPLFIDLIAQTYIDSIDCPGVSGFRSASDAIDAHRHCGETETEFWRLMLVCDSALRWQPAGVLLLAGAHRSLTGIDVIAEPSTATGTNLEATVPQSTEPVWPCWEIVYLGVAPAYRGRGYGNRLMQTAVAIAKARGGVRMELAVDAANIYAKEIYSRCGLQTMTLRAIYIRPRMTDERNSHANSD